MFKKKIRQNYEMEGNGRKRKEKNMTKRPHNCRSIQTAHLDGSSQVGMMTNNVSKENCRVEFGRRE